MTRVLWIKAGMLVNTLVAYRAYLDVNALVLVSSRISTWCFVPGL